MSELIDSQQLPCGCTMQRVIEGDGEKVLKIEACSDGLDCRNLANALGLAHEMNKPVEMRAEGRQG